MAHLNDPAIPLSTRNVEQLWEWWNSLYFDAMAKQHGCSWPRLTADQTEAAVQESGGGGGHKPIQFEGELMGVLSAMPPTVYASARHAPRKASDRWHRHASQEHSNGLAYTITKFNEPIDLVEARSSLIQQAALILGAAILGGLASIFISATAGWAAVVSFALVVILATPIAEFRELHAMRCKKMKVFINYAEHTMPEPEHQRTEVWSSHGTPELKVLTQNVDHKGRQWLQHIVQADGGNEGVVVMATLGGKFLMVEHYRPVTGTTLLEFPR